MHGGLVMATKQKDFGTGRSRRRGLDGRDAVKQLTQHPMQRGIISTAIHLGKKGAAGNQVPRRALGRVHDQFVLHIGIARVLRANIGRTVVQHDINGCGSQRFANVGLTGLGRNVADNRRHVAMDTQWSNGQNVHRDNAYTGWTGARRNLRPTTGRGAQVQDGVLGRTQ
jgi:hypothetical protein